MKSLQRVAAMGLVSCASLLWATSQAQAQTEGTIYAFGDSLLDLRYVCPVEYHNASGACGNGKGLLDYLPGDAPFTFDLQNDHAAGGAGTGAFNIASIILPQTAIGPLTQIQNFEAAGGHIDPQDLTLLSGRNDFYQFLLNPALDGATVAHQSLTNVGEEVSDLVSVGARNIVYFDSRSPSAPSTTQVNTFEQVFTSGLPTTLAAYARPGVRIRLFNLTGLTSEVEADPSRYGFTTGLSCAADPGCQAGATTFQDQHFLYDQHPTETGYALIARYIANIDASDDAVAAQASVAAEAADVFATALLDRASLGGQRPDARGVFLDGAYNRASQGDWSGASGTALGYKDDVGRVTVGYSGLVARDVVAGGAFGYAHSSAGLDGGDGDIRANSYEGGGYLDWRPGRFFLDASLAYAHHDLSVTRPGVVDTISAHPDAWTVTPNLRGGWLADAGPVRVGPVGQFGYDHTHVQGYTEAGDAVLTQDVRGADADTFNAQAGLRVENGASPTPITGFLQAAVSHDFADGGRLLQTDETYSPALPVYTMIGSGWTDRTYGQFDGALQARLAPGAHAFVEGAATVFRRGGEDYSGEIGLKIAL